MNILFFSYLDYDNLNYRGGNWITALSNLLSRNKENKIGIVYPSCSKKSKYKHNNITYYPIYFRKTFLEKLKEVIYNEPIFIENNNFVRYVIEDFKPSIIQLFGLETEFSKLLFSITNVPIVVHIQGICEPIIDRWFPFGFDKSWIKRQYPFRNRILRINTTDKYYRTKKIEKLEKEAYNHYHYYFGRTRWDRALCHQFSNHAKYYTCNEVLREEFYKTLWSETDNAKTLVSVSNGEIYKGFDVILRAAKCLTEKGVLFQWKVIGIDNNDPIIRIIEKKYKLLFSDYNVYFIGKKNASEMVQVLQNSSAFIHPSHVDNSPNSLCEAMIMGVPCIASNVGGIPSLIDDCVDGLLFSDGDYLYLASLVEELLASVKLRKELSDNARTKASNRHNPEIIAGNVIENYKKIINDFKSVSVQK